MSKKIVRDDLVRAIKNRDDLFPLCSQHRITMDTLTEILNGLPVLIQENLLEGQKVSLKGLGTFGVKHLKSKSVYSPSRKEIVQVPPSSTVKFSPSTTIKDAVNRQRKPEE